MKARGSALIIAMLLITSIGGIAFAIGRLLFIESTSASYYANGSIAYYAAESGLEEGFLRYRYNRNAEVPFNSWTLDTSNLVFRSNLSSPATVPSTGTAYAGINNFTTIITDAMKQYYDLRMGYIGTDGAPWFGPKDTATDGLNKADFPSAANTTAPYYVQKDESIKLDLTGYDLRGRDLVLQTKYYTNADSPLANNTQKCKALMEIKFVVENTDGSFNEYKSLSNYNPSSCRNTLAISQAQLYAPTTYDVTVANSVYMQADRLQDVIDIYGRGVVPSPSTPSKKVSLFLKPLYNDAAIGLAGEFCITSDSCNTKWNVVTGPSTKIESTGYYGGTSRKLVANIDRQSGTLYDLFDYVIYKAN